MKNTRVINKNWIKVACIRAIKTMAQTAVSLMAVGATVSDVEWINIASISFVAGIMSILTTVTTGIHEGETDVYEGDLLIDESGDVDKYRLELEDNLDTLAAKDVVRLKVNPKANLD